VTLAVYSFSRWFFQYATSRSVSTRGGGLCSPLLGGGLLCFLVACGVHKRSSLRAAPLSDCSLTEPLAGLLPALPRRGVCRSRFGWMPTCSENDFGVFAAFSTGRTPILCRDISSLGFEAHTTRVTLPCYISVFTKKSPRGDSFPTDFTCDRSRYLRCGVRPMSFSRFGFFPSFFLVRTGA